MQQQATEAVKQSRAGATSDEFIHNLCELVREKLRARAVGHGHWVAEDVEPVLKMALDAMVPPPDSRDVVSRRALAELVGLGPLEELLAEPDVEEIMVNGHDDVFVEVLGRLKRVEGHFRSSQQLHAVLERMLALSGQIIHEQKPYAEGSLPDGSRFHLVMPPMVTKGMALTIRRFPSRLLGIRELIERFQALPEPLSRFLELAVRNRACIVFSGGAGVGKTTLLNALASEIADWERVITLESTAELRLPMRNWVALECVRPAPDGHGGVDLRDLLRNALRMRPDRILVGECLGPEAFDLLQVMNTGHRGCMTTVHANSPVEAVERLFTLALSAGVPVPAQTLRRQLSAGIQLIVQLDRLPDGTRRVTSLAAMHPGPDGTGELRNLARLATRGAGDDRYFETSWEVSHREADLPPAWSAGNCSEALGNLSQLSGQRGGNGS